MKPTCTNCKFYSLPQHETDISCAINPDGQACNCLDYTPILALNSFEEALIKRKLADYETFRQEALTRFGVTMPDLNFDSNWLIPKNVVSRIKEFLPQVLTHQKAQGYTQEQIIIAVIQWVEKRINYHLETYDLTQQGLLSDYGIWKFLPKNNTSDSE
jgi:hypothetical protein